jgi:hypothetical protein
MVCRRQGKRVLSPESTARMQAVAHDMGTANVPPIGLGWPLVPFGATTVLSISGASPGGVAVLAVVPEYDLAFAAFGNDPRAMALHDQLLLWLLRQHLAVEVPDFAADSRPGILPFASSPGASGAALAALLCDDPVPARSGAYLDYRLREVTPSQRARDVSYQEALLHDSRLLLQAI